MEVKLRIWAKVFIMMVMTIQFWAMIMFALVIGITSTVFVRGCVEFEESGGVKQLMIDVGRDLKDIKKEIDKE